MDRNLNAHRKGGMKHQYQPQLLQHQQQQHQEQQRDESSVASSGTTSTRSKLISNSSERTRLLSPNPQQPQALGYHNRLTSWKRIKRQHTIRFQVIVWNIGSVDVALGRVPVTFRVTIFWNDQNDSSSDNNSNSDNNDTDEDADSSNSSGASQRHASWHMNGPSRAIQREAKEIPLKTIEVPPVSILNAITFDVIGSPDVVMLREDTRLMRWTCMYRATLIQNHWRVENFPHDQHDIRLNLAILADRGPEGLWDRREWKLGLATSEDSQGSTYIPYGMVVEHVRVPDFIFDRQDGLTFDFVELDSRSTAGAFAGQDTCLEVRLTVLRHSSYYDRNIMPILALLNLAAVCMLALSPHVLFQRGLLLLNISFVEVNLRMTTDKHLPSVSYQIKMQRIMNEYFCVLLLLVIESTIVFLMKHQGLETLWMDGLAAMAALSHNIYTVWCYYYSSVHVRRGLPKGVRIE